RVESIFSSIQNIAPSQLADTSLFDFEHLEQGQNQGGAGAHRLDVV
ncbi:MAG TPA: tRNA 2-thiocytidine(32) synthetase TtcA, partial [Alcanivorax sp.]|nr:tRNA 2-thiocytidine(32) synthetase TtcA [Alcanivorax sp.]